MAALTAAAAPSVAWAQRTAMLGADAQDRVQGVGWAGFTDLAFAVHALVALALAIVLGAALAYHPFSRRRIDTVDEAEAPKVSIIYAVVGAVIGLMVVEYGLVVGFVVFGIGGLFRFRTALSSVAGTGQLILVTLIGLSCGLDLPHLGVLVTLVGLALVTILDRTITYRLDVKGVAVPHLVEASALYREIVESMGAVVVREIRSFSKGRISFVFRAGHAFDREDAERAFHQRIPDGLRGSVDWQVG